MIDKTVKYRDWILKGYFNEFSDFNGCQYFVLAEKYPAQSEQNSIFTEISSITLIAILTKFKSLDKFPLDSFQDLTFDKAIARIILELQKADERYDAVISDKGDLDENEIKDSHIRYLILKYLNHNRLNFPEDYKEVAFNVRGFSALLGITGKRVAYNLSSLLEDKSIESESDIEKIISDGFCYITDKGIEAFENQPKIHLNINNDEFCDIAISFAGEDRGIAEEIAQKLNDNGIDVFYDNYEKGKFRGANLYNHLNEVYYEKAKYCLMVISENYKRKLWYRNDRKSDQERAFKENQEYILPLKLDDVSIPGVDDTIGYIDWNKTSSDEIVEILTEKVSEWE